MSHQVGPVAIMIICKDIKLSLTMLRKLADTDSTQFSSAYGVHVNKKQAIPQICIG